MPDAASQASIAATGRIPHPAQDATSCPAPSWSVLLWRIMTRKPSGDGLRSSTCRATSSLRRKAPAKPSASSARSRLPVRVSGQWASICCTRSAVAASLRTGAVPMVRRMPRTQAFTASAPVGGSWSASLVGVTNGFMAAGQAPDIGDGSLRLDQIGWTWTRLQWFAFVILPVAVGVFGALLAVVGVKLINHADDRKPAAE